MIDPKIIRDNPDRVRRMLASRAMDFDLDAMLAANRRRLDLITRTDEARSKKNRLGISIGKAKKAGQDISPILEQQKQVSLLLADLETQQADAEKEYSGFAATLPNLIDDSVPAGPDEKSNVEMRRWGRVPCFDFDVRDHISLADSLNLVDLQRAAKAAGARFYYLRDDLVRLNHALVQYALDFLGGRGYSLIQPPYMINRKSMEGAVIAADFEDVIYRIANEDLFLIGTSEHAIAAMHADEIIDGKNLPIRYAGTSPCFRKEAGAHGRDQKGIFRVHQFDKVEQFAFARPDESAAEHERMLFLAEEFYQSLGIPYRIVLLSSGDMGKVSAKTWDIEAWMAGQNAYREIVSCSNCWEYQARRLKIRFRDKTNDPTQYLHTLNSTLVATTRVLVSIMENFQTRDGHIEIPRVLRSYVKKDLIR